MEMMKTASMATAVITAKNTPIITVIITATIPKMPAEMAIVIQMAAHGIMAAGLILSRIIPKKLRL